MTLLNQKEKKMFIEIMNYPEFAMVLPEESEVMFNSFKLKLEKEKVTLNEKDKKFLGDIMKHPMFDTLISEVHEKAAESLAIKLAKKKVDKSAVIEPLHHKGFTFITAKGNGSILVIADKEEAYMRRTGHFKLLLTDDDLIKLIPYFYKMLVFYGEPLEIKDYRTYNEFVNVYENEVERSYDISGREFSFSCYTDDENDDNWTRITRGRVSLVLNIFVAYIFIKYPHRINELPKAIQEIHPEWLVGKAKKDEKDMRERQESIERAIRDDNQYLLKLYGIKPAKTKGAK